MLPRGFGAREDDELLAQEMLGHAPEFGGDRDAEGAEADAEAVEERLASLEDDRPFPGRHDRQFEDVLVHRREAGPRPVGAYGDEAPDLLRCDRREVLQRETWVGNKWGL